MEHEPIDEDRILRERFEKFSESILGDEIMKRAIKLVSNARLGNVKEDDRWLVDSEPLLSVDDRDILNCGIQIRVAWLESGSVLNPGAQQATYGTRVVPLDISLFEYNPRTGLNHPARPVFDAWNDRQLESEDYGLETAWRTWLAAMRAISGRVYEADGEVGYAVVVDRETGRANFARHIPAGTALEITLPTYD